MNQVFTVEDLIELSLSSSPREFLNNCIKTRKKNNQPHSFAFIARSAGFQSRSFPREISIGKKSLTLSSAKALAMGLKLESDLQDILIHLVELESIDKNAIEYTRKLKKLSAIRERIHRRHKKPQDESALIDKHFSAVYASLGSPEVGATLQEIEKKTKLNLSEIHSTLEFLLKLNLVRIENNRYIGMTNHLAFTELKNSGFFNRLFLNRIQLVKSRAASNFHSSRSLFQETTFSVRQENLSQLKSELRNVILKFVDENENSEGDHIVSLMVSFISLTEN